MTRQLATSHGGRWVAVRDGRALHLLGHEVRRRADLAYDDIDLAFVGSPEILVEVARADGRTHVALRDVPSLETVARLELEVPASLAAITGNRLALAAPDARHVAIVRVAAKALAQQAIDVGSHFEFVIGLERDQLLFGLAKELKVWDAVAARPLVKLSLPLPPPPRSVGVAAGHVWATRPDSDDVYIYRLSDGRPFHHRVGANVERVVSHPASPVLVLVTARGLVRLHCLAHTVTPIERTPWTPAQPGEEPMPLAQHVIGPDEVGLLGLAPRTTVPWRVAIAGTGGARGDGPLFAEPSATTAPRPEVGPAGAPAAGPKLALAPRVLEWREALAAYGDQLVAGGRVTAPVLPPTGELADLAERLALAEPARRVLAALYGLYLVGAPAIAIARIARELGEWSEPLGRGELAAIAMLRRREGRVALRPAVADLLDGAPPRAVRLVGDVPATPRAGAFRVSRDGRGDADIEAELVAKLGRIAIAHGPLPRALLEARLHGATAVALAAPGERPTPWPRGAGLVLVLYGNPSAWVADVPTL